MPKIALFGTSADPPTAGHQAILDWLAQRYDRVAVWASDNPFKTHQTPLRHREAMLKLLIETMQPDRQNVQLEPELSYPRALMTVEQARQRWPNAAFTLVIGSDLVAQLPRWYRIEALLQQVDLLIVPRQGYAMNAIDLDAIQHLGAKVTIANVSVPGVSSTTYREEGNPDVLTPPIEAYIHREQLYTCQDAPLAKQLTQPYN